MVLTSTEARIEGCRITAYKGIVLGETWNELLRHAQRIGANAVLSLRFDNALDVDTLFHGASVVIEPQTSPVATTVNPTRPENQVAGQSRGVND